MRASRLVALILAAAVLAPLRVSAQGVFDMGVLTNSLSQSAVIQHEPRRAAQMRQQRQAASAGLLGHAMAVQAAAGPAPALRYTPTPALARETAAAMVARLRPSNPTATDMLQGQLGRHDYRDIWRGLAGRSGLRDDNATDAVEAYMILGWLVANNQVNTADDPAGVQEVRRQLAGPLAGDPALADPATRAALGEEVKLLFVVVHSGWQSAQREGNLAAYANGIAQIFMQFSGQDLRRVALTSAGFRPR